MAIILLCPISKVQAQLNSLSSIAGVMRRSHRRRHPQHQLWAHGEPPVCFWKGINGGGSALFRENVDCALQERQKATRRASAPVIMQRTFIPRRDICFATPKRKKALGARISVSEYPVSEIAMTAGTVQHPNHRRRRRRRRRCRRRRHCQI
jgi:hypothetical protein